MSGAEIAEKWTQSLDQPPPPEPNANRRRLHGDLDAPRGIGRRPALGRVDGALAAPALAAAAPARVEEVLHAVVDDGALAPRAPCLLWPLIKLTRTHQDKHRDRDRSVHNEQANGQNKQIKRYIKISSKREGVGYRQKERATARESKR